MVRARVAVTVVFALNGVLFASIFSRLPAIKDKTSLNAGALGLALLCSMLGLLLSQLGTGPLVARFGSRPVMLVGALGYAAGLIPVALSTSFGALAASFFFVGITGGALDVSMNVHGITVERGLDRPILATLHAGFSFGGLIGAVAGGLVAAAGVDVVAHLVVTAAIGVAVTLVAARFLLPRAADATPEGPRFARPTKALVAVGIFAFCVLLSEGAVNDWAAVYLDERSRDRRGAGRRRARRLLADDGRGPAGRRPPHRSARPDPARARRRRAGGGRPGAGRGR